MTPSAQRVAVIGGGMTGVITALELAEAGVDVDLYETSAELLTGATWANEGKIHLGFVYALDGSRETARVMLEGARAFTSIVSRYVERDVLAAATSTPFLYAVPRDSMVGVEGVRQHFAAIEALIAPIRDSLPGEPATAAWHEVSTRNWAEWFDPTEVVAVFQTSEVAIDPQRLSPPLRSAAQAHNRINVRTGCRVRSLNVDGQVGTDQGSFTYDRVVNAAWQQRLALDATAGIDYERPVYHRYKVGVHGPALPTTVPSVTFLLGTYGDVVRFRDRSFQSWYPAGMIATSSALAPPDGEQVQGAADLTRIANQSAEALGRLMPSSATALRDAAARGVVAGGWITAWGRTDIDDPRSQLHERHQIGVSRHGRILSIDTGKYTTAPLLGAAAARQVVTG